MVSEGVLDTSSKKAHRPEGIDGAREEGRIRDQLTLSERRVIRVLEERWPEIREDCPDRDGSTCEMTGDSCTWRNCPKLAERGREEGSRHG